MHVDIVLQHLLTETEHMRKKNQQVRRRRRWYSVHTRRAVTVCERKFNSVAPSHKLFVDFKTANFVATAI